MPRVFVEIAFTDLLRAVDELSANERLALLRHLGIDVPMEQASAPKVAPPAPPARSRPSMPVLGLAADAPVTAKKPSAPESPVVPKPPVATKNPFEEPCDSGDFERTGEISLEALERGEF